MSDAENIQSGATVYVEAPAEAVRRGSVTPEEMGLTAEQYAAMVNAGICVKPVNAYKLT
jgi:hypothetical protein